MKKYISIDIGGTAIKYGLISQDGKILCRYETSTEAYLGGPVLFDKITGLIEHFHSKNTLSGICISTAGMVDTKKGEVIFAGSQIPNYAGTRYKERFEAQFSIPCEVENDVNCAGLAEYFSGAGQGVQQMLMLTIGTGIGGCLVLNGQVYHGFSNRACEIGYLSMQGRQFQDLGSASAVSAYVAAKKKSEAKDWSGRRIFECAKQGDSICVEAIDRMTDVLAEGIVNLCCVIDPGMVVLGGGIMAQEEYLRPKLQKAISMKRPAGIAAKTRLAFALHRNDAGMLGAFYHFQNCHVDCVDTRYVL